MKNRLRRSRLRRLGWSRMGFRGQLITVFCCGILLTALISSTIISVLTGQTIRDRFVLEGQRAVETLAMQSTLSLLYQSAENAMSHAEAALSAPDAVGVAVIDVDGNVLLSLGDTPAPRDLDLGSLREAAAIENGRVWHFVAPVFSSPASDLGASSPFILNPAAPELLGYSLLTMSPAAVEKAAREIMTTNLLVSGVLAALLLSVLLLITRRLTRPIQALAGTMRDATSGERNIRANVAGPRDVTEMQRAFNSMMGVLNARENELRRARDSALEIARVKGEFAATVSHELRTPLNGVLGMLELLKDMGLSDKQAEYVEVAHSSGEALLALINDILDFSRNDSGRPEPASEEFELRALLDEVVGLVAPEARRKGLEAGFTVAGNVSPMICGDPRRLQQVLLNLVGNAIKFTRTGEIRLAVSRSEACSRQLRFEVSDTGIGIPKKGLDRIFEPFRQLDGSTTRRYGGSGLGLAICRQLVEFSGGEIGVESVEGEGSCFWFTLPLAPSATAPPPTPRLDGKRVLVAAPDGIVRAQVIETCKHWGMRVSACSRETELLDRLARAPDIDVVLLDESLICGPAGAGRSLARAIQAIAHRAPGPLLVLRNDASPGADKIDRIQGAASLEKPVRISLLRKRLNDLLGGRQATAQMPASGEDAPLLSQQASVLVVEDNRANQLVVAGMLERLGFIPALASDGREALELLASRPFDLILMDCNMPDMDGYQTTAAIREMDEPTARTPIIAMTANVQESDAQRCLAAGMDDFLSKPLKLSALRDRLHGWMNRRSGDAEPPTDLAEAELPRIDEALFGEVRDTLGPAFSKMLGVFREDLPPYIEALCEALGDGDAEQIIGVAHAIKGSAANIGAMRIADICRRIETAAGHGDLDTARELRPLVRAEAKALLDFLETDQTPERGDIERKPTEPARILVADDDRSMRTGLRSMLEPSGYTVVEAHDGRTAIEQCREHPPDLILMDAKMPGIDGFSACETIKAHKEFSHIPVLIITGLEDDRSIERAFAVGATDYVPKPVHFAVLRRRIVHLLTASRAESVMRHLAYNDPLTGLANRIQFTEQLTRLLKLRQEQGGALAVLFIDVDRFKLINDSLGHDAGDMLLKAVGKRILRAVRDTDLVARLGGDEFTVIIDDVDSRQALATVAEKICRSFTAPIAFMGREIYITLSIGISVYPDDAADMGSLMKHADTAMFHAKRYRDDFRFFEPEMAADVSRRLELENDLRRALDRDELVVHYQPQAHAATGEIVGVEALVRWDHPERGLVSPLDFIPLAEEIGLIDQVGETVLRKACQQLRDWLDAGHDAIRLAINISGRQLERREVADVVARVLASTEVPPWLLELEITESVLMEDAEHMIGVFGRLKDLGLHIAIDDFGTGYSSLAYLKRFPVSTIKIDRSFVRGLPEEREDTAIVSGIIALARGLGLKVVAEGVETEDQLAFLRESGCDIIQGFHLSRPLPAEAFEAHFLRSGLEPLGDEPAAVGAEPRR